MSALTESNGTNIHDKTDHNDALKPNGKSTNNTNGITPNGTDSNNSSSPITSEQKSLAEEHKTEGNRLFSSNQFSAALDEYTKAIELDSSNPIFYSNRSFCHLRLEEYGSAINDATKAIELDKRFIKAYYRRGAAYLALGKYKDARRDFLQVTKIKPTDKDAKSKLFECEKAIRKEQFSNAIASEKSKPASELINIESIIIESSYTGPRLDENGLPNLQFIKDLIIHFKSQKRLHKRIVYEILITIIPLLKSLNSLIEIDLDSNQDHFTLCGDVHGQFYDVCNIFEINGLPSDINPYLFNGDFVDRGSFSLEVIMLFFSLKLLYPHNFHLLRGNHESITMNQIYGFQGEVSSKVDSECFDLFTEAFNWLPLSALLGKKVLVVHGGLFSEDGITLDQIRKIDRFCQPPETGLMCELLWSDPQSQSGRAPSKRGVGLSFGPDVTKRFLEDNNLELIVRSHEVKEEGYQLEHDGKLITVFSAPNYCDSMGNKGAFIKFDQKWKPNFTKFTSVPHPAIQPMAYATGMSRFFSG